MVEKLRQRGYITSKKIEEAMLSVDRAIFIKNSFPYEDTPYPVGMGQTISAPSVVAFMLEHLDVERGMKVLEIGTGSGYNTVLLSYLVGSGGHVISIEKISELHGIAKKNLAKYNFSQNIELYIGDGSCGYEEQAPYDRIIVTAAMPNLDKIHPFVIQLKEDGKIVAPVGSRLYQDLIVYEKKTNTSRKILPVMFVPLIGKYGFQ